MSKRELSRTLYFDIGDLDLKFLRSQEPAPVANSPRKAWLEDGEEQPVPKSTEKPDLREPVDALRVYKQNFDLIDWSK